MKPISVLSAITLVLSLAITPVAQAQSFGTTASAVWITDCNQSNYFNTSGAGPGLIGPAGNTFTGNNFGAHTYNSGTLVFRGGEVRTFKVPGVSNVCGVKLYYNVHLQSASAGAFTPIDLSYIDDCDIPTSQFPSGGSCAAGEQKWNLVIPDGASSPAPIDLTTFAPGNYVLEVYYEVSGSNTDPAGCLETVRLDNGGTNFTASFSIQQPVLSSANPITCNGTEGFITISGLTAGAMYSVSYTDDGAAVGPNSLVANGSGQITISGLDAGLYSDFVLDINGCSTNLNTGLILSNPVIIPKFNKINPFCAGTPAPALPATSLNGISGTWNPAVIDNQTSRSYTFTPTPGQCGLPVTINVTVTPRAIPSFTFGTSRTICAGDPVPVLPNTSTNGITGTWSPATVDDQNSATYTFTPTAGLCANPVTFTLTVNPNIAPVFSFGTTQTICASSGAYALPTTSDNGITGTWSPGIVDDQNSATYTFTPNTGQCATPFTLNVTVNPNTVPTFSFGPSLTICAGDPVPGLPSTSDNGITGTWNQAAIDDQNSATYTFTPTAGLCATPFTLTVTVNPNITPVFSFGTSKTICAGEPVPTLVNTSDNGITGTWLPAVVDDQNSNTYTFTPDAGQCATPTTFTLTVNPNITPVFGFGTSQTFCEGSAVPSLPTTSDNGITGTWLPASIDNQNSATYTFTPTAGQCAVPVTLDVTINPKLTPTFGFGPSLSICANAAVPALPGTSDNGITGTWNEAGIDNQNSATYTFTPDAGQCATTATLTVTVAPNITPVFSFGTSKTICANDPVPPLPSTSDNGITGTWLPAVVDDQNSNTYTFTPDAGQCAVQTTFTVTVNPNLTPTFSFGTSQTICANDPAPALPTMSLNGITGTWSPATVDVNNSGSYLFTSGAGQCATTASLNVTVNPVVTPVFGFGASQTICAGSPVPALPTTSDNGITGTWSPAVVDPQNSNTYTFTPDPGQCAPVVTFTMTVNPNSTPAFDFGPSLTICDGGVVPTLPNMSNNGITGTWNPATVDIHNSDTYTFTPDAGQCALPVNFTVTVNPIVTPTFSFPNSLSLCEDEMAPTLITTSTNGITGTWSPAVIDNKNSGTYTFTPAAGQCADPFILNVTVNPNTTPVFSFGPTLTICEGSTVPSLPTTSDNGVSGTWNPSAIDNQNSNSYTFTPSSGQCALSVTLTVTVNPKATPVFSFGTALTICDGQTAPALPTTSDNGITGTWSPATIDIHNSNTYTFTPDMGECAVATSLTVTVNPVVTPVFGFGPSMTICAGGNVPALVTTSDNGITGTWDPATIDRQNSGTYTFTPSNGQCAVSTSLTVTVNPNTVPTFGFGPAMTICAGSTPPSLPGTSDNGITGTWSPVTISNQVSQTYTFTPTAGICATPVTLDVTVVPNAVPGFDFGTALSICKDATAPTLPATSTNGITGTWNPAVIDNQNSGNYTFTPDPGQCATSAFLSVTVNPNVTPTFSFGPTLTICAGSDVPNLPSTSDNGIPGTWSPATIDKQNSGSYRFTPATGQCAVPVDFTVTVTPNTVPLFGFGTSLVICAGDPVPVLPTSSDNSITGSWSPAVVDPQHSGVYTFTPNVPPGLCISSTKFIVTVNPILTPAFSFGNTLTICSGSTPPALPTISDNGITGTWSPSIIDNQNPGTYTFTSAAGQCAAPTATLSVTVTPTPTMNALTDTTVNDGSVLPGYSFTGTPAGVNFTWSNSNTAIGLGASGTGNIPSFVANNKGGTPITATITVTPVFNGCSGTARNYVITVNPLIKDIFVPNVFSPNGDGKNDILYAYGNYISKLEMRIFNQWGQQVQLITDPAKGWDGKFKGTPQPVGVYVYTLKAVMTDGRTIQLKGNITLLR